MISLCTVALFVFFCINLRQHAFGFFLFVLLCPVCVFIFFFRGISLERKHINNGKKDPTSKKKREHGTLTPNIVIDKSYAIKENYALLHFSSSIEYFLTFFCVCCDIVKLATMCSKKTWFFGLSAKPATTMVFRKFFNFRIHCEHSCARLRMCVLTLFYQLVTESHSSNDLIERITCRHWRKLHRFFIIFSIIIITVVVAVLIFFIHAKIQQLLLFNIPSWKKRDEKFNIG